MPMLFISLRTEDRGGHLEVQPKTSACMGLTNDPVLLSLDTNFDDVAETAVVARVTVLVSLATITR